MLNLNNVLDFFGGIPPILVDFATFGSALLGGYVAINPPANTDKALKRLYVILFVVLGAVGVGANIWQRGVESHTQEKLQQNETDARKQFSANLQAVKESADAILILVAHPPQGVTEEQVSSLVRHYLKGQNSGEGILPDDVLRGLATTLEQQMHQIWYQFDLTDIHLQEQLTIAAPDQKYKFAAAREQLRLDLVNSDYNRQVIAAANFVRDQLLKRLKISDTTHDWVTSGLGQFGGSNENYLRRLVNQLPK